MSILTQSRLILMSLSACFLCTTLLEAAPKKTPASGLAQKTPAAKVIQVPKTAGAGEIKPVETHAKAASNNNRVDFAKTHVAPEKSAPSGYTMDASKQEKAYEFVSIPLGGWSTTDALKSSSGK